MAKPTKPTNITYNDTFAEKWVNLLAPPEWRHNVTLKFCTVSLSEIDGAGCLIDFDVLEGWRLLLRNGKRIPPLVVCATERGTYYVHDGNHRLEAICYEYGPEAQVRVAVMVPLPAYRFRKKQFARYETYVLEPHRGRGASVIEFLLPLMLSAIAVALTVFLPGTKNSPYFVLLLAAVLASAWLAGLSAGLIATAFAVMLAAFFLIEPIHSLAVAEIAHLVQLAVAALTMLFFSWLLGYAAKKPRPH